MANAIKIEYRAQNIYENIYFERALSTIEPALIHDKISNTRILFDYWDRYRNILKLDIDEIRINILTNVCILGRPKIHFRIFYKLKEYGNNKNIVGDRVVILQPKIFYKQSIRNFFPVLLKDDSIKIADGSNVHIGFGLKEGFNEILDRQYLKNGTFKHIF